MLTATFHGHACFLLEGDGKRVVIDPFLTGNPAAVIGPDKLPKLDAVLLSHGHSDHLGDAVALAKRDKATVVATYELAQFCGDQGATAHAMHIGGAHQFPFGRVKLVPAFHGGRVDGDPTGKYTTNPCGLVVTLGGKTIYHTGDTALTVEMQLLTGRVDLMLCPIGDNYTMGPEDALRAVGLLQAKKVLPIHYNTWDVIAQDAAAWAARVRQETKTEPVVLKPGEWLTIR